MEVDIIFNSNIKKTLPIEDKYNEAEKYWMRDVCIIRLFYYISCSNLVFTLLN